MKTKALGTNEKEEIDLGKAVCSVKHKEIITHSSTTPNLVGFDLW
jgi:hypothetical protein